MCAWMCVWGREVGNQLILTKVLRERGEETLEYETWVDMEGYRYV